MGFECKTFKIFVYGLFLVGNVFLEINAMATNGFIRNKLLLLDMTGNACDDEDDFERREIK